MGTRPHVIVGGVWEVKVWKGEVKDQTKVTTVPWWRWTIRAYRGIWIDPGGEPWRSLWNIVDSVATTAEHARGCFGGGPGSPPVSRTGDLEYSREEGKQTRTAGTSVSHLLLNANNDSPLNTTAIASFASQIWLTPTFSHTGKRVLRNSGPGVTKLKINNPVQLLSGYFHLLLFLVYRNIICNAASIYMACLNRSQTLRWSSLI